VIAWLLARLFWPVRHTAPFVRAAWSPSLRQIAEWQRERNAAFARLGDDHAMRRRRRIPVIPIPN
jgi:hypothetical protein